MFSSLPTLQKLVRQLQQVPYLASKNVYRIALHFLSNDLKQINNFCTAIIEAKKNIKSCPICFNWTENSELCSICSSTKRDKNIICVVETWYDLFAIEKSGGYDGVFHVLGGALCPLEGIGQDDLNIESLIKRVDKKNIKEIIMATNPTPEGEATASFISSRLDKNNVDITRLASGVPIGSSLEYMDRVTIYKALSGRRPF